MMQQGLLLLLFVRCPWLKKDWFEKADFKRFKTDVSISVSIGPGTSLFPDGTKQITEPMLIYHSVFESKTTLNPMNQSILNCINGKKCIKLTVFGEPVCNIAVDFF